jgi:hypothetical protein
VRKWCAPGTLTQVLTPPSDAQPKELFEPLVPERIEAAFMAACSMAGVYCDDRGMGIRECIEWQMCVSAWASTTRDLPYPGLAPLGPRRRQGVGACGKPQQAQQLLHTPWESAHSRVSVVMDVCTLI